jgi:hypothetical protein
VIHVSKRQLSQVEYLIGQSILGNHVLFDAEMVRRVLVDSSPIETADAHAVEHHIEKLILQPSIDEKRAYLEGLDQETLERVVRTYFNIVENNLYETSRGEPRCFH